MTFAPNESSKTFVVPVIKDTQTEGEEKINLTLSEPTGNATLGTQSTSTIKISD